MSQTRLLSSTIRTCWSGMVSILPEMDVAGPDDHRPRAPRRARRSSARSARRIRAERVCRTAPGRDTSDLVDTGARLLQVQQDGRAIGAQASGLFEVLHGLARRTLFQGGEPERVLGDGREGE